MLTLPSKFEYQASIGSQDKVYLVSIGVGGDLIRLSTKPIKVNQYIWYPFISSIQTTSTKWNITEPSANNVTISSPKLTIKTETTVDGYNLSDEFYTQAAVGKPASIYLGYSSFDDTSDFLKIGDFIIDDIEQNKNELTITFKNPSLPDIDIAGGIASVKDSTIGGIAIPAGHSIHKNMDGKRIPLIFGYHWSAPMQPLLIDSDNNIKYYYMDANYHDDIITNAGHLYSGEHFNLQSQTSEYVLIKQSEDYVPLPRRIWWDEADSSGIDESYNPHNETTGIGQYLKLWGGLNAFGSLAGDSTFFLNTPMKYTKYTAGDDYNLSTEGTPVVTYTTDDDALITAWFPSSPVLTIDTDIIDDHAIITKLMYLDRDYNLRHDHLGVIHEDRLINLPETSNFANGSGFHLGRIEHSLGTGKASTVISMHLFTKTELDTLFDYDYLAGSYIISSYDIGKEGNYNKNTKVYGEASGYTNTQWTDTPTGGVKDITDLVYLGEDIVSRGVGYNSIENEEQNFDISTFNKTPKLTARLTISYDAIGSSPSTLAFYQLYSCWAGSVSLTYADSLYAGMTGIRRYVSGGEAEAPPTELVLSMPHEYLQFIIEAKLSAFGTIGTSFGEFEDNWKSIFENSRVGSGFAITETTKFKSFVEEYVKYEPWTLYLGYDEKFEIISMKIMYSEDDQVGKLNYNDANEFLISYSDKTNVITEIKSLKTDYSTGVDKYVHNVGWKLNESEYDYGQWRYGNSVDSNQFAVDSIEKKYSSFPVGQVDRVERSGKKYFCVRDNDNIDPATDDGTYWKELVYSIGGYGTLPTWDMFTRYHGLNTESFYVASYILNMYANRKRIITFKTTDLTYMKYQLGDVVGVENCPYKLLGMTVKGFAGDTTTTVVVFNGQDHYSSFIITGIRKEAKYVEIEAMQIVNLGAYIPIEQAAPEEAK